MAFGGKCTFSFCLVLSCSLPPLLLSHFLFACGWRVCPCGLAGGWQRCGFDVGLVVGACAGWLGLPTSLPFFCLCFSACLSLISFTFFFCPLFSFSFSFRVCCLFCYGGTGRLGYMSGDLQCQVAALCHWFRHRCNRRSLFAIRSVPEIRTRTSLTR